MKDRLNALRKEALQAVKDIADSDALELFRRKYLGRKGELASLSRALRTLGEEERRSVGVVVNSVKDALMQAYERKKKEISGSGRKEREPLDITMPGESPPEGHIHILSSILREWEEVFAELGFSVLDGPEAESDYYNFEALNIPSDHPARDMWDTIYVADSDGAQKGEGRTLLRTHTSPVQIRAMEQYGAPLRVLIPGRVFRYEATDARHEHTFDQIEGLMVDRNISLAHLIGIIQAVVDRLVGGKGIHVRVRPGYFPFTEPSIEFDLSCILCGEKGCPVCKGTGWLEFGGAGLVHPKVISAGGLDPSAWSGFAFGMGPARLAMLKYGIDDIRLFRSGDIRFLRQFS